ncbi:Apc15p protein-domain-containing protein [Xylariales sp. PMI_506]|nr:Apc15p protein-domain-containing protein [Xylariales sp. PMI_506]
MLSLLPDLAPRDSHSLWYTSSRSPLGNSHEHVQQSTDPAHGQGPASQRRNAQLIDRSPLARLRADEQNIERRLHNVAHFGSTWLKPPGVPKTLHQIREERREQDDHQEALRREQLAQELADAEAEAGMGEPEAALGGAGDADADDDAMGDAAGSDAMDDVQLDGARDLDDEIPEADDDFALSPVSDDSDEDTSDNSSEDDEEPMGTPAGAIRTARLQQGLMTQRMRHTHDQLRDSLGGDEDEVDEEDQEQMIEEGDVLGAETDDMGMDVDLDDDVPEAESLGGYEHTDSEAELSSSDSDNHAEMSFAAARGPRAVRFRASLARSDATRNSIAVSDILSRDGSSMLSSSPQLQRRG